VIKKKTLKTILSFTENQHPAPSFIGIYILTWLAWHNQVFTQFINAQGDFLAKLSAAFASIEENQYLVVLLLTGFIFTIRLGVNYLSFKSKELLNEADDDFANARDDQKFAGNSDISNLMATLERTQQQLLEAQTREKKAITDKNDVIKKLLHAQHELEEVKADIHILSNKKMTE